MLIRIWLIGEGDYRIDLTWNSTSNQGCNEDNSGEIVGNVKSNATILDAHKAIVDRQLEAERAEKTIEEVGKFIETTKTDVINEIKNKDPEFVSSFLEAVVYNRDIGWGSGATIKDYIQVKFGQIQTILYGRLKREDSKKYDVHLHDHPYLKYTNNNQNESITGWTETSKNITFKDSENKTITKTVKIYNVTKENIEMSRSDYYPESQTLQDQYVNAETGGIIMIPIKSDKRYFYSYVAFFVPKEYLPPVAGRQDWKGMIYYTFTRSESEQDLDVNADEIVEGNLDAAVNNVSEHLEEWWKNVRIRNPDVFYIPGQDRNPTEFWDVFDDMNKYSPTEKEQDDRVVDKTSKVLTIITNVGMITSVIMLAVIGLKYMLGSVEEKAEYKKDLIPYLVGAILLFGITTFVKIFMQWGNQLNNL